MKGGFDFYLNRLFIFGGGLRGAPGGGWERSVAVVVERGSSEWSIEKVYIMKALCKSEREGSLQEA